MKFRRHFFALIILFLSVMPLQHIHAAVIAPEISYADYFLVCVPIPNSRPIIEWVAKTISSSKIKDQEIKLTDITQGAITGKSAMPFTMPKILQDKWSYKQEEQGNQMQVAAKGCAYEHGSGKLLAEPPSKQVIVTDDKTTNELKTYRDFDEWFDANMGLYTITSTNRQESVDTIDITQQRTCRESIPGNLNTIKTNTSENMNYWGNGGIAVYNALVAACLGPCGRSAPWCVDVDIYVHKSSFTNHMFGSYSHSVGNDYGNRKEEKVNYNPKPDVVETGKKGGWTDTGKPNIFQKIRDFIDCMAMLQGGEGSIHGKNEEQAFETAGFGDKVSQTVGWALNAILWGHDRYWTTVLPRSLCEKYLSKEVCTMKWQDKCGGKLQ